MLLLLRQQLLQNNKMHYSGASNYRHGLHTSGEELKLMAQRKRQRRRDSNSGSAVVANHQHLMMPLMVSQFHHNWTLQQCKVNNSLCFPSYNIEMVFDLILQWSKVQWSCGNWKLRRDYGKCLAKKQSRTLPLLMDQNLATNCYSLITNSN